MLVPGVVTLHEVSQAHILRRLALYPFSIRSKHIIFTTEYERRYASTRAPWISGRCTIIPIGTNIAVVDKPKIMDIKDVIYFGLIRPQKGLEDILDLASLIKESGAHLAIRIIGKPHPKCIDYYHLLRKRFELPDAAVADLLSRAAVAYMPFPDGASERRSSLMTLLANGIATITTKSPTTPSELDSVVKYAANPGQALQVAISLIDDTTVLLDMSAHARGYAGKFTWEFIAARHMDVYRKLLERS
jgi:glycosyltransferase involved in cell wall biosynthesis